MKQKNTSVKNTEYELKYCLYKKALEDLDDIVGYISNILLEPKIAKNLFNLIINEIKGLDKMPLRNKLWDDEPLRSQGIRVMLVKNYFVFYYPDENKTTVYIARIIYTGRDIAKQLDEK